MRGREGRWGGGGRKSLISKYLSEIQISAKVFYHIIDIFGSRVVDGCWEDSGGGGARDGNGGDGVVWVHKDGSAGVDGSSRVDGGGRVVDGCYGYGGGGGDGGDGWRSGWRSSQAEYYCKI